MSVDADGPSAVGAVGHDRGNGVSLPQIPPATPVVPPLEDDLVDDLSDLDLTRPTTGLVRRQNDHRWVCTGAGRVSNESLWQRLLGGLPLLRLWAGREFTARYRQSVLDVAWSIIQPAATVAIYGVLLVAAFHVTGDGLPYLSFAWAGMTIWAFVSNALAMAVPGLSDTGGAMGKTYFPREVIPLAVVGAALMDLVVQTTILVTITIIQGVGIDYHMASLVVVYAVAAVFTAGICVLWAGIAAFVRDVRHATGLILQAFFFASAIVYPISKFPPSLKWTTHWNPISILVEATRDAVLRHRWPAWNALGLLAAVAMAILVTAIAYVRATESRMVDLA